MFSTFFLILIVASWLLLRFLLPFLRLRLPDEPNARSSHLQRTPRGGGIAFVVVASMSSAVALFSGHWSVGAALPLLGAPLAFIGLLDDRHNLPSSWRYSAQLLMAALLFISTPLPQSLGLAIPSTSWLQLLLMALLLIAITAIINFTNFMDGLDGLVAGSMAVSITAAAIQLSAPWPIWALVSGLLGFIPWNWSPAKVFMGDVGSTYLGAVFAGLVLQASSWLDALGLLLVATPLLGDACICVIRRLLSGQRVFQAHRLHLFQRLHQAGWSHARVSFIYIAATAVSAIALLIGGLPWVIGIAVVELLLGVLLDHRLSMPFAEDIQNS